MMRSLTEANDKANKDVMDLDKEIENARTKLLELQKNMFELKDTMYESDNDK